MNQKKRKGSSIIFVNNKDELLLYLRDKKGNIPCPNMWDLLGGNVEEAETPSECIVREIKEEIGIDLRDFHFFTVEYFPDREEHVYWKRENLDISKITLTEGQKLQWFSFDEIKEMELAFDFSIIVNKFLLCSLSQKRHST